VTKQKRGFAVMPIERRSEIASQGGKAAHIKGTAHEFNSVSGRSAGLKGGAVMAKNKEHMSRIGKLGAAARIASQREAKANGTTPKQLDEKKKLLQEEFEREHGKLYELNASSRTLPVFPWQVKE
jgi:general stress protein YciG